MNRNGILAFIFVISIVFSGDIWVSAAAEAEKGKSDGNKLPLSPGPSPSVKIDNSSKSSSPTPQGSEGEAHGEKTNNQEGSGSPGKIKEDGECNGLPRCADNGKLFACLQDPGSGSQEIFLLVKNEGVDTLIVDIKAPASSKISMKELHLEKHEHKKINVSASTGDSLKIVLNAGNGDCVLQLGVPGSAAMDFLRRLPSYATRMTPIYGAYFLFLTVLIVGGTWAFCKFGRRGRRGDGGVPYQELEMGLPQSSSAANTDAADGWDQGWDDDWEEQPTTRTSEIRPVGNVSANGLTSRLPNKEGWDDDWDD